MTKTTQKAIRLGAVKRVEYDECGKIVPRGHLVGIENLRPSVLIRLALDDLEAVERSRRYIIGMSRWHHPLRSGKCVVCLAGGVMATGLPASQGAMESDFPIATQDTLRALDLFRRGDICPALILMGLYPPANVPFCCDVTPYDKGRKRFKTDMRGIASMLEEAGL